MSHADVFGCFNNLFRLLQLGKIYEHCPFYKNTKHIFDVK